MLHFQVASGRDTRKRSYSAAFIIAITLHRLAAHGHNIMLSLKLIFTLDFWRCADRGVIVAISHFTYRPSDSRSLIAAQEAASRGSTSGSSITSRCPVVLTDIVAFIEAGASTNA